MDNNKSSLSRWIKWTLLLLVLIGIALGVVRALNKRKLQQEKAAEAAASLQKAPVYTLSPRDILVVKPQVLAQTVAVSGTLQATRSAVVRAKVAGEIRGLDKREGETVKAGEVLARIDSAEASARVRQAEQQAAAAKSQVDIAERAQQNNQALVKQGFISPTALENSSASLASAQATHLAAVAALDIARKGLSDTTVVAPIDGVIGARTTESGERVAVGGNILQIVDLRRFEVEVALPPGEAASVAAGQGTTLQVDGLDKPVNGSVERISPTVQTGTRSVLAYLEVPAVTGMRQGMFAKGLIQTGNIKAMAVPLSAIRNNKPQPYLLVVRDGRVVHIPVALEQQGQKDGVPMVALAANAGMKEGDVVLDGTAGLIREGIEVRLPSQPGTGSPATSKAD